MRRRVYLLVLSVALLLSSSAAAQQGTPAGQWPAYGGDHGSTKYSPLDQIDAETVERLGVVWRWDSPDNAVVTDNRTTLPTLPAAFKSTPVLADGVLYIKTSMSQAVAIDAATGETLWVFDPGSWEDWRPANTGYNSRGVAYWSDGQDARIFLPTGNAYLWAIDARTGRPIADFGADGAIDATQGLRRPIPREDYQLMSAPIVVGDVVVIGSVIMDRPQSRLDAPGDVRGFDVRTGEELWEFHTVPQPGEFGNETWEDGSWEYSGATNAWGMLTADPELGYVYLPIGTPTNDYYGGHRHGDNVFAESIVCVDAATGERVWHFQFIHHGLWDYDATAAPTLVDIEVDGRPIKAVAVVTKQGYTYVFDRVTGEPVWPIEERPVKAGNVPGEWYSPTQPHPTKPPPFDRQGVTIDSLIDFTPELRAEALEILNEFAYGPIFEPITLEGDGKRGTIIMPGAGGGANWHGAAADPETGWLYVPSRTAPTVVQLAPADASRSDMRYQPGRGARLQGPRGLPLWKPPYVRLSAFDLNDGTREWVVPLGDGPRQELIDMGVPDPGPLGGGSYTGPLLTKTLLFLGFRGRRDSPDLDFRLPADQALERTLSATPFLLAFDKATGETVHALELDVAPTGTPMTYMRNGKQFIVLAYGTANDAGMLALALE